MMAEDDPVSGDLPSLDGAWMIGWLEIAGEAVDAKQGTLVVRGTRLEIRGPIQISGKIELDPRHQPPWFDIELDDGKKMVGLYDLRDEELCVCFASAGRPRPASLVSTMGNEQTLVVVRRSAALKKRR